MADPIRHRRLVLADGQTLTASYVVTSSIGAFDVRGVSQITIFREYAPGSGETSNTMELVVETNVDETPTNWHQEGTIDDSTPTAATDDAVTFQSDSTNAGSTYLGVPIRLPVDASNCRIRIKETGVATNFGTATVRVVLRYL